MKVQTDLRAGATTTGGGYVNGVWYPDMSGYCAGSTPAPTPLPAPIPPTTASGGWVNGVWYPDMSGTCA